MTTKSPLLFALVAVSVLAGCRGQADTEAAQDSRYEEGAADPVAPPAGIAEVVPAIAAAADNERASLGVLNAINEHEIAVANQALQKGVQGPLADYARLMVEEHTDNRDKTLALNPDPESAAAIAQHAKGVTVLRALGEKSGDDYAKAFVDAMVNGHTEALATLDKELIPGADSEPVKQHLTAAREHVAHHLALAQELKTPR